MFVFGAKSRARLETCHPSLRAVATRAIELTPVDFGIVWGFRGQAEQDDMVRSGVSKTPWPTSKHNRMENGIPCSEAFDFAPVVDGKIPWDDTHLFSLVAGVIFAAAVERGVKLRWGADWSMNGLTTDQSFMDWGHIEVLL